MGQKLLQRSLRIVVIIAGAENKFKLKSPSFDEWKVKSDIYQGLRCQKKENKNKYFSYSKWYLGKALQYTRFLKSIVKKSGHILKASGITFQSDLKWNKHINHIIPNALPKLSMLKKITKRAAPQTGVIADFQSTIPCFISMTQPDPDQWRVEKA